MKIYKENNIEGAQTYSSITFQHNTQTSSPTGEETRYPTNRSLGDWEGLKSGWVINVISYKMNKKFVNLSIFLSLSSILTFTSPSSLTFFFPCFCHQLILIFWYFNFDIHTFSLRGSMGLLWQHASMSVTIIACCGNTLLCLSSLVMSAHLYVCDCHRLWWQHASVSLFIIACVVNTPLSLYLSRLSCWVNRHIFINVVIYKI